jgi:hypothetical protein
LESGILQQARRGKPYDAGSEHCDWTAMSTGAEIDSELCCSP